MKLKHTLILGLLVVVGCQVPSAKDDGKVVKCHLKCYSGNTAPFVDVEGLPGQACYYDGQVFHAAGLMITGSCVLDRVTK